LLSVRKILVPTLGWAFLTILLQIGDIATAPQYKMTIEYFARYLFGLWAYDGILLMQGLVIAIVLLGRSYQKMAIKKRKQQTYFDMGPKSSRRDFLQIGGTIGVFLVLATGLGIWANLSPSEKLPPSSLTSNGGSSPTSQTSSLPSGAISNVRDLQVGVPKYFDYPSSGYTNMLMKKADGSVAALSILCTHVCCQCQYDSASTNLNCPCHGSVFDQNGNVLRGPAGTKLPSVQLSIDSNGNIFPVKIVGSGPCVSA
jgi:Rieske Fe-S protein